MKQFMDKDSVQLYIPRVDFETKLKEQLACSYKNEPGMRAAIDAQLEQICSEVMHTWLGMSIFNFDVKLLEYFFPKFLKVVFLLLLTNGKMFFPAQL